MSTAASTPTNAPVQRPTAPDTPPATTPGHAKSGHPEHATRNPKPRINTGGPHTAEGKATAARNATFHGIYSAVPVIPGLEADAQWTAHRLGIAATLNPQGQLEEVLVERIAALLWRLRRVLRYETNAAATAQEEALANVAYQRRVEVERLGLPGLPGRPPSSASPAGPPPTSAAASPTSPPPPATSPSNWSTKPSTACARSSLRIPSSPPA